VDNVKSREDNSRLEWDTTPSLLLNVALVGTTEDLEVTIHTPVSIPGVGAEPVLLTILLTIAKKTDSVTTLETTRSVRIDTRGIAVEIGINFEGNFEGTIGSKLSLVVLLTDKAVGLGTLALISIPVKSSVASATLLALRSVHAAVVTSSVRIALIRDNTSKAPVLPGAARLTTVARTAASIGRAGAAVDIFSRKSNNFVLMDTHTIRHSLSGTEGPAGTTVLLVADLAHGSARGPLGTSIKGIGGCSLLGSSEFLNSPAVSAETVKVDTKKTTSLALGHTSDGVVGSLPGGLLVVDLTDHAGADSDLLSEDGSSDKGDNKGKSHFLQ